MFPRFVQREKFPLVSMYVLSSMKHYVGSFSLSFEIFGSTHQYEYNPSFLLGEIQTNLPFCGNQGYQCIQISQHQTRKQTSQYESPFFADNSSTACVVGIRRSNLPALWRCHQISKAMGSCSGKESVKDLQYCLFRGSNIVSGT